VPFLRFAMIGGGKISARFLAGDPADIAFKL